MPALFVAGLIIVSAILQPAIQPNAGAPVAQSPFSESMQLPLAEIISTPQIRFSKTQAQDIAPLNLDIQAAYVVDLSTNESLIAYQHEDVRAIASLTKIMSALVYLEEDPDLDRIITLTRDDFVGGTAIRMPIGTRFYARDILHATLIGSANNAAAALYKGTDLGKEEFIEKMNEKAEALGLKHTHFTEPSGLSAGNVSTAEEFAIILAEALENPILREIASKSTYGFRSLQGHYLTVTNTSTPIRNGSPNIVGGKNGFINASMHTYAVQINDGESDLIAVVLGDRTANQVFVSTQRLLDYAKTLK